MGGPRWTGCAPRCARAPPGVCVGGVGWGAQGLELRVRGGESVCVCGGPPRTPPPPLQTHTTHHTCNTQTNTPTLLRSSISRFSRLLSANLWVPPTSETRSTIPTSPLPSWRTCTGGGGERSVCVRVRGGVRGGRGRCSPCMHAGRQGGGGRQAGRGRQAGGSAPPPVRARPPAAPAVQRAQRSPWQSCAGAACPPWQSQRAERRLPRPAGGQGGAGGGGGGGGGPGGGHGGYAGGRPAGACSSASGGVGLGPDPTPPQHTHAHTCERWGLVLATPVGKVAQGSTPTQFIDCRAWPTALAAAVPSPGAGCSVTSTCGVGWVRGVGWVGG